MVSSEKISKKRLAVVKRKIKKMNESGQWSSLDMSFVLGVDQAIVDDILGDL